MKMEIILELGGTALEKIKKPTLKNKSGKIAMKKKKLLNS